jgi:hypothetical protein
MTSVSSVYLFLLNACWYSPRISSVFGFSLIEVILASILYVILSNENSLQLLQSIVLFFVCIGQITSTENSTSSCSFSQMSTVRSFKSLTFSLPPYFTNSAVYYHHLAHCYLSVTKL